MVVRLGGMLVVVLTLISAAGIALGQDVLLDFNIRSLPLPTALEQYGDVTGRNILYGSALVAGRRSTAVGGHLSPDGALKKLLEGTKLSAVQITSTSFTLSPAPVVTESHPQNAVTDYYGRIQHRLHDALCNAGPASPGGYRVGMRLWIDEDGIVARHERLNSTGASPVDAGIDEALDHLRIGARPPRELAQPVSLVILPQSSGLTMSCADWSHAEQGHD
jgi:hypothetical protein